MFIPFFYCQNKDILRFLGVHTLIIFFGFFGMHLLLERGLVQFGLKRIDDIAFLPIMALGFVELAEHYLKSSTAT